MKSLNSLLALVAIGLVASPGIQAQNKTEPSSPTGAAARAQDSQRGPGAGQQGAGQMMNPEARVAALDRAVTLTPEQKTSITAIYTKARDEAGYDSGNPEANREKMQQSMQSTRSQVMALLTPEQKAKFEAMPQQGGMHGGPEGKAPHAGGQGQKTGDQSKAKNQSQ